MLARAGVLTTPGRDPGGEFLKLAVLLLAGAWLVSLFSRRIGGKGGGAEKASVGAWLLLASVIVGIMVATR